MQVMVIILYSCMYMYQIFLHEFLFYLQFKVNDDAIVLIA